MIQIRIRKKLNLSCGAEELVIYNDLPEGQITALYGESGAGKTSLLNMLAGLMSPDEGSITCNGTVWVDTAKKINVKPQQRSIGYVFQDYALFPHMTVKQNLLYAAGKKPDNAFISKLLDLTKLSAFAESKPSTLSGGQQQRVALARALANKPDLLLLDEPLSAVDNETRLDLQEEISLLHRELRFTALLVSHDVAEITRLASVVWEIDGGTIVNTGTPVVVFGMKDQDNHLQFTGQVAAIEGDRIEVLVNRQVIHLKNTGGYHIGDSITLRFNAGDAMMDNTD